MTKKGQYRLKVTNYSCKNKTYVFSSTLNLTMKYCEHHWCSSHLMCMRLASMLQGALGVTGTGMPFFWGGWKGQRRVNDNSILTLQLRPALSNTFYNSYTNHITSSCSLTTAIVDLTSNLIIALFEFNVV